MWGSGAEYDAPVTAARASSPASEDSVLRSCAPRLASSAELDPAEARAIMDEMVVFLSAAVGADRLCPPPVSLDGARHP